MSGLVEFKNGVKMNPVIGQEVICSNGLGRISEIIPDICGQYKIRVDTYIKNYASWYASTNVEVLPLGRLSKDD